MQQLNHMCLKKLTVYVCYIFESFGAVNLEFHITLTENSEIFARVLFSRNFAYAKFRENKILAKC